MKASCLAKTVLIAAVAALCPLAPSARPQPAFDDGAESVHAAVSPYVGGLQGFSTDYAAVDPNATKAIGS